MNLNLKEDEIEDVF